jgi:hypothetical protein
MKCVAFAIPEALGAVCAEVATRLAGGATLLPGFGWWVNGGGEIERERIAFLLVGTEDVGSIVEAIKEILRGSGEQAIFYAVLGEGHLEWL